MEELVEKLKVVLASAVSLSIKAQNYHWNVTGPNFIQYHEFLGEFYQMVGSSVDVYGEQIRILGAIAPASLKRYSELTIISDEIAVPSAKFMFVRLAADNLLFINEMKQTRNLADTLGEHGLVNILEGYISTHEKYQWMLEALVE